MRQKINQSGLTLMELVAGLPLVALVTLILTLTLVHFVSAYRENFAYIKLQNDLFAAIETMRLGYIKTGINDQNEGVIGVTSAANIRISLNNALTLYPLLNDNEGDKYSSFYVDKLGALRCDGRYTSVKSFKNALIFPDEPEKLNTKFNAKIDELEFYNANPDNSVGSIKMLGIKVKATVRIRDKATDQSPADDKRYNLKTIIYETQIYATNVL